MNKTYVFIGNRYVNDSNSFLITRNIASKLAKKGWTCRTNSDLGINSTVRHYARYCERFYSAVETYSYDNHPLHNHIKVKDLPSYPDAEKLYNIFEEKSDDINLREKEICDTFLILGKDLKTPCDMILWLSDTMLFQNNLYLRFLINEHNIHLYNPFIPEISEKILK